MTEQLTQTIAGQIKSRRKQRGWSLDKLANASGVSKAMLGQIERLESSPTVATLWKIATGLCCSFSELTTLPGAATVSQQGADAGRGDAFFKVKTLFTYQADTQMEMFELTISERHCQWSQPHAQGVYEHIVVQSGQLGLFFNGQWHLLQEGDSCRFAANQPHAYQDDSGYTRFTDVICYTNANAHSSAGPGE
ncbi:helix-turn-helix domain-containing protein [Alteromonas gilva]|uniref:XRE family transcriptional regulator n=1 Tax=Alteromonas gilva TaxID=2987522 RepID=A0ABT5L2G6_9ALTE|nr:XRE family transcriptional regulator [Alteromonas gilva]MDC8829988.1 XRE family transcriptional regulator [Alteromonas gilva]